LPELAKSSTKSATTVAVAGGFAKNFRTWKCLLRRKEKLKQKKIGLNKFGGRRQILPHLVLVFRIFNNFEIFFDFKIIFFSDRET